MLPWPGVLTKLDIMDRGTDASAILRNEVVPLRLGYIGLVCRSQADIVARRSMRDARAAEQAFFESHPEYHEVRSSWEIPNARNTLYSEHPEVHKVSGIKRNIDHCRAAPCARRAPPSGPSSSRTRSTTRCAPRGESLRPQNPTS